MRPLLTAALLVVLSSCGDDPGPRPTGSAAPEVRMVSLSPIDSRRTLAVTGFLQSHRDVTVSAEIAGRVTERPAAEGDHVAAGAELVVIDERELRIRRDLARIAAEEAALRPDADAGARRQRALDLELARDRLDRCRVRAPLSGCVERIFVEVGEWVRVGDPVARVVDYDALRLVFDLSEEEIVRVDTERLVTFTVDAWESETFTARVVRQGRAAEPSTRKFELELEVVDRPRPLHVGMFARATLDVGSDGVVLAVPKEALFRRFETVHCYVAVGDGEGGLRVEERRLVTTPLVGDLGHVAVESGLEPGDELILGPLTSLRHGLPVRPASAP